MEKMKTLQVLLIIILTMIDAKVVNIKLPVTRLAHQKPLLDCKTRGCALVTGYGGGKTLAHCLKSVKHSQIDNNGIPHMIVSPSFPVAKKTLIPTMHEVLENIYGLKRGKDYRYNKSDHEFNIYKWNGLIWVGSGNNPDSLNGPNLGSFGIDEPGQQTRDVYNKMLARLRHPKAKLLQWWLTGTPEGLNWFYDVCEGEEVPKDFTLIRGKTTDNIHLPQSFIDDLYDQYDEQLVKAYIEGLFVNLMSGSAYYSYSDAESTLETFTPSKTKPLLVGMDFNYDPMCTIIGQEATIKNERVVVIFDELYLKNCDTDASCERLIEKYKSEYKYMIYPDPACYTNSAHGSAKSDIRLIRNAFERYNISTDSGYWVDPSKAHPKRKDRLNAVNKMFKNSRGKRRLFVTNNCRKLKEDLRKATMEEYLNANFEDKSIGHISDALGYMVQKRYPVKINRLYAPNIV